MLADPAYTWTESLKRGEGEYRTMLGVRSSFRHRTGQRATRASSLWLAKDLALEHDLLDYRPACPDLRLELRAGSLLTLIAPQSSVSQLQLPIGGPIGPNTIHQGTTPEIQTPVPGNSGGIGGGLFASISHVSDRLRQT